MNKLFYLSACTLILAGCAGGLGNQDDTTAPRIITLECGANVMEYQVPNTPMKFCYDPTWGEPVVQDQATAAGTQQMITFSGEATSPSIWIESTDFAPVEGEAFCFDCLQMNAGEASLKAQVAANLKVEEDSVILRKSDIGAQRAIRTHLIYDSVDDVRYYVPNAYEGHNVLISAANSIAEGIDEFAFDIIFAADYEPLAPAANTAGEEMTEKSSNDLEA
jgi:hypothetical protein